ncbi:MAG: ABC transporter permease subunit [Chloroflexi bacterium]|nr:ABC transporter permease subunit [Chloroflexota bacterium]
MNSKSVATWSVAIAVLILVYMALFPSVAKDAELLNEMMANFPEALLTAFGLNGINLSTVPGYYSFVFLFVQICLAIQAANYGFSLVSIEEREWTADFLLSKPIGRTQILTSKLLAALSGLTLTNAVVWISSLGCIEMFKGTRTYETKPLLLMLASVAIFQLFFLSVGLVVSLLVKRIRSVTPYSMALAFGMYVLSVFGDMLGENTLEKITPFKHFEPRYIVQHGAYDLPLVLFSVSVIVISLVSSYMLYTRRDIPAMA